MNSLRVLITNNTMAARGGTELYVRDLALDLVDRGHKPVIYTTRPGEVAAELRAATIPVIDRLDQLGSPPDVIHGHHHVDAMIAMLRFNRTPAVFMCHGWLPWEEWPPRFSHIYRYLAVDEVCRDRMVCEHGLSERDVEVLLNFVDLSRFLPRSPLPERPQRAMVFSNEARDHSGLETIRNACSRLGIECEVRGIGSGLVESRPEMLLGRFDLVFARARSALEAMAVGAAVVLYGPSGAGPLVSSAEFDRLRPLNFGIRALRNPCTVEHFVGQILKYDARDAAAVSARVRQEAGRTAVVDRLVEIYHEVIVEHSRRGPADTEQALREVGTHLQNLAPRPIQIAELQLQLQQVIEENRQLRRRLWRRLASRSKAAFLELLRRSESPVQRLANVRGQTLNWLRSRLFAGEAATTSNAPMPVIVGSPRSGTTLLRLMLDSHPELAIPPETGFLVLGRELARSVGDPVRAFFDAATNFPADAPVWPDFQLPASDFHAELRKLQPFTLAQGFRVFYRMYAARFGKRQWGDKTPMYGRHLLELEKLLPEVRFIHLIRDGRDAAVSLREQWFTPGRDIEVQARYWRDNVAETRRQGDDSRFYLEIQFEELVRDTESVLRRICTFCELPWHADLLRHHERAAERLGEHGTRMRADGSIVVSHADRLRQQAGSQRPPDPARIGAWRAQLSAAECHAFETIAGDLLAELGYTMAHPAGGHRAVQSRAA